MFAVLGAFADNSIYLFYNPGILLKTEKSKHNLTYITMIAKLTLSQLLEARNDRIANHRSIINPQLEAKRKVTTDFIRQLAIKTAHSYFRIDLCKKKFSDVFSAYHPDLKHPTICVSDPHNLLKINRRSHPKTLCFNLETDVMFYDIMMELPFEDRKKMVSVQTRYIQNETGKYEVFLITTYVEECDVVGTPCSLVVIAERMEMFTPEEFYPYRQFYLQNETNPDDFVLIETENKYKLKGKELEIIQLGVKDMSIEDMSQVLNVSEATIKTHRANVMLKLNAPTFALACLMAKRLKIA